MILYIARPSVLESYKIFHQPPIKRIKADLVNKTIEIWFDAQTNDESFDIYHLDRVLPGFDMKTGDCWMIETELEPLEKAEGPVVGHWKIIDKQVKLQIAY